MVLFTITEHKYSGATAHQRCRSGLWIGGYILIFQTIFYVQGTNKIVGFKR